MDLWRKAVRAVHGEQCVFCGDRPVECHHIIKRRHYLTRWDYKNGIPLCHKCHDLADTMLMRERIISFIGNEWFNYLSELELVTKKSYMLENDITDAEFKREKIKELKEIISGKIKTWDKRRAIWK